MIFTYDLLLPPWVKALTFLTLIQGKQVRINVKDPVLKPISIFWKK